MKLIIEGDERKIKRLSKELSLRVKRDGLNLAIEEKTKVKTSEATEPKKAEKLEDGKKEAKAPVKKTVKSK